MTPRQQSEAEGKLTYDTGKSCLKGHVSPRYVKTRTCVECHRIQNLYTDKRKQYCAKYASGDKFKDTQKKYRATEKGKSSAIRTKFRRELRLKRATPKWLTPHQIEEMVQIYKNRPEGHEVDHIIPLQGVNVCGLHVPWNLQYLTIKANRSKSNSH